MINYEELLRKYIEHVVGCEGADFLSTSWVFNEFTPDELLALYRLAGRAPDGRLL